MDNTKSVSIKNLKMQFGNTEILRDINLDISEGEFVTLLGPSGCGKTTLLRIIAGFQKQTSGDILIDGKNANKVPAYKRGLGMVFQNYALWPHKSVEEHISFGLKIAKLDERDTIERTEWALNLVGLLGLKKRMPSELSGGQQQRVALARAISLRPRILLLDEPLSNLDRKLRDSMRLEIRQLQQELGVTTIYVTHDQQEAITMSDKIVVLLDGQIEQIAAPKELYEIPKTSFVANFLGTTNLIPVDVIKVSEGKVSLNFGNRMLILPVNNSSFDSGHAYLVLRPENMTFTNSDIRNESVLYGRIKSAVYEGKESRYEIAIDGTDIDIVMLYSGTEELPLGKHVALDIRGSTLVPKKGGAHHVE